MPALPWCRLDSNIAQHDKILGLIHDEGATAALRWQAISSYVFSFAWSTGQGTDGFIPRHALGSVHGTTRTARLLVAHRLWSERDALGWDVVNFGHRQQLQAIAEAKQGARRDAALKANCTRHHGKTCWTDGRCSRDL